MFFFELLGYFGFKNFVPFPFDATLLFLEVEFRGDGPYCLYLLPYLLFYDRLHLRFTNFFMLIIYCNAIRLSTRLLLCTSLPRDSNPFTP
jgi:hypothetical protein